MIHTRAERHLLVGFYVVCLAVSLLAQMKISKYPLCLYLDWLWPLIIDLGFSGLYFHLILLDMHVCFSKYCRYRLYRSRACIFVHSLQPTAVAVVLIDSSCLPEACGYCLCNHFYLRRAGFHPDSNKDYSAYDGVLIFPSSLALSSVKLVITEFRIQFQLPRSC